MKCLLIAALLLACCACVHAQLYVYHVTGEAFIRATPVPVPLRPRSMITPGQTLLLRPGAQVILFDQQGRNIAYTTVGPTDFPTLLRIFEANTSGPCQAYLSYVWKILQHHDMPTDRTSGPVGGVSRGDGPQILFPADSAVLDVPLLEFAWRATEKSTRVWFTLLDGLGRPLLQMRLPASSVVLNSLLTRLTTNTLYYWTVSDLAETFAAAPRRAIVLSDAEDRRDFTQELGGLPASPEATLWQQAYQKRWFYSRAGRPIK